MLHAYFHAYLFSLYWTLIGRLFNLTIIYIFGKSAYLGYDIGDRDLFLLEMKYYFIFQVRYPTFAASRRFKK